MNAGHVIELAKEWVDLHGSHLPGFRGAHLMGSLNTMPREAHFPAYKDVDINLVLEETATVDPHEISYKGLILEYGTLSEGRYRSAETVLSDPELASNLLAPSILSDPTGKLAALQTAVRREYCHRKWVLARCGEEKRRVRQALAAMRQATTATEAFFGQGYFVVGLTGLIAIARLRPPTHRSCLVLTKEVLEGHGQAALHEDILRRLGYAHITRAQAQFYLQTGAEVFDRAVQVNHSPVQFGFKLQPHVRPYIIEAAQAMIDAGHHREAMFWIGGFIVISNGAIQANAPSTDRPYYQAKTDRLLAEIGLCVPTDAAARAQRAAKLASTVFQWADDVVSSDPNIVE